MKMKLFILCALAIVLAGPLAAEPAELSPKADVHPSCANAHQSVDQGSANALRVVIDEETGRLRAPTAEEAAAFHAEKILPRNIESMPVEKAADGTLTVRLGGAFLKAAIAKRAASGELTVSHDAIAATPESAVDVAAVDVTAVKVTKGHESEEKP